LTPVKQSEKASRETESDDDDIPLVSDIRELSIRE